ncbi:MAG: acyl-CoA dehydrogenase family protein [Burkholderiaceae bacterium]
MDFEHTEEQRIMLDGLRRLIERDYEFTRRTAIAGSEAGHAPATWLAFAEMGVLALPYDEADGGFESGALGLMPVMQALGEGLVLEPVVSSLSCGRLIAELGSDDQRAALLPALIDGTAIFAFAHLEAGARHPLQTIAVTAVQDGDGYRLSGDKVLVDDASCADRLLVVARLSGGPADRQGLGVFVVDAKAPGLRLKPYRGIDDRRGADLSFDAVRVGRQARLGVGTGIGTAEPTGAANAAGSASAAGSTDAPDAADASDAVAECIDFATTLICCEAVGLLQAVNAMSIDYLRTRRQFGVPIGSFQALQHVVTEMANKTEQAYSIALLACAAVDAARSGKTSAQDRIRAVSAAKIKLAEACRYVGQRAVQLHGGMGMALEMKVAHAFKRLTVLERQFGDADYHLGRFAAVGGAPGILA